MDGRMDGTEGEAGLGWKRLSNEEWVGGGGGGGGECSVLQGAAMDAERSWAGPRSRYLWRAQCGYCMQLAERGR